MNPLILPEEDAEADEQPLAQPEPESVDGLVLNNDIMRPFFYPKIFTPQDCERILTLSEAPELTRQFLGEQQALMQGFRQYMQARIRLLNMQTEDGQWLHQHLKALFDILNQKHYHFDVSDFGMTQIISFKNGEKLDWHMHLGAGIYSTRKLSLGVFLTPLSSYEGGAFEILARGTRNIGYEQGTVGIMPAYFATSVQPVVQGEMHLLMTWMHGHEAFI